MRTDSLEQIQQGGPFGNARFEIIRAAGHLPHLEQPEATCAHIEAFLPALRQRLRSATPIDLGYPLTDFRAVARRRRW
ncbi:hypothetical protein [Nocardia sp. NPDC005998]|uniref:alpha/beta fold hydrolase n=1 Tax=Nocardia sp. NPDC005998 TaxID=3156894 RepID=UPI0033BF856F